MSGADYGFPDLPLADVRSGTNVLLTGPSHAGTRELGLRLLAGSADEGAIIVTTNRRAARIAADCEELGVIVAADRTAILDCVDDEAESVPARVLPVSGPSDLTGISMRFTDVYREFDAGGITRVRTGVCSVSTLLTFGDFRTVSRFVHMLTGRIDSVGGIGVFTVDPTIHDDRVVSTLAQFCSSRIDVRDTETGPELRALSLPGRSRDWEPFDVSPD